MLNAAREGRTLEVAPDTDKGKKMDWLDMFLFDGDTQKETNDFEKKIDEIINLYENNSSIPILQRKLNEAYSMTNKPGCGKKILDFPSKDKLCEFYTLCLIHDWTNDNDIKDVFAENGFYCAVSFLNENWNNKRELMLGCLDWFLLLCAGKDNLKSKIYDALWYASNENSTVFSKDDYSNGIDYITRQFKFVCATFISPLVNQKTPGILSPSDMIEYQRAKNDFVFASFDLDKIINKANYISNCIQNLLKIM